MTDSNRSNAQRSTTPAATKGPISRVRYAGANGLLTVRADSGFYTHPIVAACRKMKVRYSITVRQHAGLRNLIEAIPEAEWTPIPYRMETPPTWPRPLTPNSRVNPMPCRCASSSAG